MKFKTTTILFIGTLFLGATQAQEEAIETLEAYTVVSTVSTKTEKAITEVLPSVDSLLGADLQRRQIYTVEDALSYQSGVGVVQTGQAGGVTSLFVRGQESNHTLVTLNGRRLAPGLAGLYNLELLDVSTLESVELQRGPASTLYGSDALAGVLDLQMADARFLDGDSVNSFIEAGSFDTFRTGNQIRVKDGPVGIVVDASYHHTSNDRALSDFENTNLRGNVAVEIGDGAYIDVLAAYQDSYLEVPGSSLSTFFPESQINENNSALFSPRFSVIRDDWDFDVYYSYNSSELEASQDVFGFDNLLDQTSHEAEAKFNFRPSDSAQFTVGAGYYENEFSRTPLIAGPFNTPSDAAYSYTSIFGQADIDVFENLNLIASARYDDHDSFESKATYSSQLTYTLPTNTQLFGKVATGYKAPSGQDFVFLDPSVDPSTILPEESFSWEVGARQFLPNDAGSVALTFFQADIDNLVDSIGFPAFPSVVDTETEGIELEVVIHPCDFFDVYANYTWLDATITGGQYLGGFGGLPGDALPRRPEHTYAAGVALHQDAWRLGAEIRGAADRLDSPGVFLSDFTTLRAYGSYQLNENLEIFGRVENILDEEYETTTGYLAPSTAAYGGLRISF